MNYAGGMVKEALEELNRLERELTSSTGAPNDGGAWTWLGLVKSAVGFSGDGQAGRARPDWKFLTEAVMGPSIPTPSGVYDDDKDHLAATSSTSSEQTARYIQALKDYIVGSVHWGYETELYFGQKGDEVRSFGWVFLAS